MYLMVTVQNRLKRICEGAEQIFLMIQTKERRKNDKKTKKTDRFYHISLWYVCDRTSGKCHAHHGRFSAGILVRDLGADLCTVSGDRFHACG